MYPLDGRPTLEHVTKRVAQADSVIDVVVATSTVPQDDVIEQCVPEFGAEVIRGSESNVLSRFDQVINQYDPTVIVRVTGDCPLIDSQTIDTVVERLERSNADYATNTLDRTFPRGLDVEAFTAEAFKELSQKATRSHHREHVTPYYRENPDQFTLVNVTSEQVFDEEWMQNRSDLRLTLDESEDYEVIRRIYENVPYKDTLPVRDAIRYVDDNNLMTINESVEQKEV